MRRNHLIGRLNQQEKAAELMAEDVRLAMRALGRITGRADVEDYAGCAVWGVLHWKIMFHVKHYGVVILTNLEV